MKTFNLNRREFIKTTGAATAGMILTPIPSGADSPYDPKGLPTKVLGRTGVHIPMIIIGCGSRFMVVDEDKGLEILEYALDHGLYYWDTANSYKNKEQFSEERLGKLLKSRRKEVFLSSKVIERDAYEAEVALERSFKRLQTDHINLCQVHSISNEEDVKKLGNKDGVLPVLKKYQEQGVIQHIGFTGHTSASAMKLAAEMYDFDTMLIALNHQEKGKQPFEELPVPYAANKGMGVLAMKVIRPRETVEGLDPKDLIRYALSLNGITSAVIGTDSIENIKQNIEVVKDFKPFDKSKMEEIHGALEPFFKSPHLPWMQPDYLDGIQLA